MGNCVGQARSVGYHGDRDDVLSGYIVLGGISTNVCVDTTAREAAAREFRVLFLADGTANFDLPDGGLGAASAEELQRTALAP